MTDIFISKVAGTGSVLAAGASGAMFALNDAVSISIVTSVSAVLMAGISAYFAFRAKAISEGTHRAVNSRMTELLELAKKSFRAEGVLQEQSDEKVRKAATVEATAAGVAQEKSDESLRKAGTGKNQGISDRTPSP